MEEKRKNSETSEVVKTDIKNKKKTKVSLNAIFNSWYNCNKVFSYYETCVPYLSIHENDFPQFTNIEIYEKNRERKEKGAGCDFSRAAGRPWLEKRIVSWKRVRIIQKTSQKTQNAGMEQIS